MKPGAPRLMALCAALAVSSVDGGAHAQGYPAKPIRFIVPYATGGGADAMARFVAPRLSEELRQQVIIDNRAGAGSNIGNELAARAPADGYTLLMGAAALAINVSLYGRLSYDPLRDFAPVVLLAASPNLLVVHPSLPVRSVKELVALAKAAPGQINYASGGSGTTPHLAAELFKSVAGVDLVHVPYKSAGPALIALLSGEISVSFLPTMTAIQQVNGGRLRALGITSLQRSSALPRLPTVAESGLPGFEASQWYGVLVPAGTPPEVVATLNGELNKVVRLPEIRDRLVREGSVPFGGTAQEFAVYLKSEVSKWAKVVKTSGAKVE